MKLYEACAAAFAREGIDVCFALLGDANMHWAAAFAETGAEFIYTRHEHAAVAGAAAYARASSKIGCATVTCGPGLTQLMTILPIAVRAQIPVIVFAGEAPLMKEWYNQKIEQAPFVAACGARYHALHDTDRMIDDIHAAIAEAMRDNMVVVLGVPFDLQQQPFEGALSQPLSTDYMPPVLPHAPDPALVSQAATWIAEAKRPIVLAGLGAVASDAHDSCVALAEHAGALLATTLPAKGYFRDQAFSLGVAGGFATEKAKEIFRQADLVIGVGSRLAYHAFNGGKLTPDARVIHIDIDPQTHVQGRKAADLLIASDAAMGAQRLAQAITPQPGWRNDQTKQQTAAALVLPDDHQTEDGQLHPMAVVKALTQIIGPDCHVINTSGHCAYYAAHMNLHPQSHFTVIRDFGAIGNGTSFALGIAAAHPERPIVLIDGDGSTLMHIQELETMRRHNLKILTIVMNDGAYGSEVHKLRADGVGMDGAVFGRPDFAGIGTGFGLGSARFSGDSVAAAPLAAMMADKFAAFLAQDGPHVWDVHISDKVASPQILSAHKPHG